MTLPFHTMLKKMINSPSMMERSITLNLRIRFSWKNGSIEIFSSDISTGCSVNSFRMLPYKETSYHYEMTLFLIIFCVFLLFWTSLSSENLFSLPWISSRNKSDNEVRFLYRVVWVKEILSKRSSWSPPLVDNSSLRLYF